jgi:hypothetical protein
VEDKTPLSEGKGNPNKIIKKVETAGATENFFIFRRITR